MIDAGFVDEVARLAAGPGGLSVTAREAIGYKEILAHLDGDLVPDLRPAAHRRPHPAAGPPPAGVVPPGPAHRLDRMRREFPRHPSCCSGNVESSTRYGRSVTTLNFSKLHATGNDFLVLVDLEARFGSPGRNRLAPALRAALCDRRRGVGADGLIRLLGGSDGADCEMELTNADGGLAEISGNGLRCLAHVAAKLGLGAGDRLVVDTAAGRREMTIRRRAEDGEVDYAEADMGLVMFTPEMIPVLADSPFDLEATVDGVRYTGDAAGVGNPHFVVFVDDPDAVPLDRHGPVLETDARFPNRTNVEMVGADRHGAPHADLGTGGGGDRLLRVGGLRRRRRRPSAGSGPGPDDRDRPRRGAGRRPRAQRRRARAWPSGSAGRWPTSSTSTSISTGWPTPSRWPEESYEYRPRPGRRPRRAPAPPAHRHRGRPRGRPPARPAGRRRRRQPRRGRVVAGRAGAAHRHRRRRAGGAGPAAAGQARPGHLHREGQGRGARGSWSRCSTSTW